MLKEVKDMRILRLSQEQTRPHQNDNLSMDLRFETCRT